MRKQIKMALVCLVSLVVCACGVNEAREPAGPVEAFTETTESAIKEDKPVIPPNLSQVRSICELATLECYYHNVAKSRKEAGSGIAHWGEKERIFWIEYTGVAKIGIDMSKVRMSVDGTIVTITMPESELQSCKVEDISASSYISSEDSWNKNPITAEDQTAAVAQAQTDMETNIRNDSALLERARNRAQKLIENYIHQLGQASGVDYAISWEYEER